MLILGVLSLLMIPLALGLREPRAAARKPGATIPQGARDALQEAFRTQGFWLLTIGFFVCGFHVTLTGLPLPAYVSDKAVGMSFWGRPVSALEIGGWAIGFVGLFNIAGSFIWGWLGTRYPKKDMLALLYALRSLAFAMFLAMPLSWLSVLLFAASLGFLWLGTAPPATGPVRLPCSPGHRPDLEGTVVLCPHAGSL